MKNLHEYILDKLNESLSLDMKLNEASLLDDIDDLIDNTDSEVRKTILSSNEFIKVFDEGWELQNDNCLIQNHRRARYYNLKLNDNKLSDIIDGIDTMILKDYEIDINSRHQVLSPDNLCKNLVFDKSVHQAIIETSKIKDMNISVNGKFWLYCKEIENTNIDLGANKLLKININGFPRFKNVTSNAEEIQLYSTFIFDYENDIDNILAVPYKCKIKDNGVEKEVTIKNFKKASAIVNNRKRYTILDNIIRIKPGLKLNDVINIKGFKNLKRIVLNNNNIMMEIIKGTYKQNAQDSNYYEFSDGWYGKIYKL